MWSRIHKGIICLWYSFYFYSQEKKRLTFCTRQWSRLSRITDTEHCLFEDLWTGAVRQNWQAQHTARSFQRFLTLKHPFTEQLQKIRAKYDNVETVGFSQLLLPAIALERYNQALHYMGLQNWYLWKLEVGLHGNIRSTVSIFMASVSVSVRLISRSWLHTLVLCNGPEDRH